MRKIALLFAHSSLVRYTAAKFREVIQTHAMSSGKVHVQISM